MSVRVLPRLDGFVSVLNLECFCGVLSRDIRRFFCGVATEYDDPPPVFVDDESSDESLEEIDICVDDVDSASAKVVASKVRLGPPIICWSSMHWVQVIPCVSLRVMQSS